MDRQTGREGDEGLGGRGNWREWPLEVRGEKGFRDWKKGKSSRK